MKRQSQVGLLAEGNAGASAILRIPNLSHDLGPVKSGAFRVARRLSNMLRAGYAVAEYEDLQAARLVLIRVPDERVSRIVEELCASGLPFRELAFVLCETWLTTEALEPLRARGASVATLLAFPSARPEWFILEGQISAVRQVRRFLEGHDLNVLEIRSGCKYLYFAAELLITAIPIPVFATAQRALRASGLSGNHLYALMEGMSDKLFRDFIKGSRLPWGGPLLDSASDTSEAHLENLRRENPEIAAVVDEQLSWARNQMIREKSDAAATKRRGAAQ
jgi:predicted short-subunit dehydrogenase-like oxidoreductase (DUF2520 family)